MSPLFETMYSNSGQGDSNVKGGGRQVTMGGRQVATKDCVAIKFWSNFDNFETAPLPKDKDEYLSYKSELLGFVQARNQRILNSTTTGT